MASTTELAVRREYDIYFVVMCELHKSSCQRAKLPGCLFSSWPVTHYEDSFTNRNGRPATWWIQYISSWSETLFGSCYINVSSLQSSSDGQRVQFLSLLESKNTSSGLIPSNVDAQMWQLGFRSLNIPIEFHIKTEAAIEGTPNRTGAVLRGRHLWKKN